MKLINSVKALIRPSVEKLRGVRAKKNFRHERKIKRTSGKIRVGFLAQYIPAWNKFKPLYEALKADERFEVFLICVPQEISANKLQIKGRENGIYDFFIKNGYEAMNALIGENKWLDLRKLNLNYIFYPRPYNGFMPKQYHTKRVSRYSKICSILYGMELTEELFAVCLNKDFYRNVYCYFAESETAARTNIGNFPYTHKTCLQKTVSYGMPVLAEFLKEEGAKSPLWDFAGDNYKIIWTPRWTTDLKLGGSNFFTYKEFFIEYAKKNGDVSFVFRPHPLMFSNFLTTGEMSQEEVDCFIKVCEEEKNLCLDQTEDYIATFWNSDALVTDISGVLPEYFVTGKPVVFCATNMILTPAEHTKKLMEGCYNVNSAEELHKVLHDLKMGIDPLKEKRTDIIKELWGADLRNCVQKCVEELAAS